MATKLQPDSAMSNEAPPRDEISAYLDKSWDDLFAMDAKDVEDFQLTYARQRLTSLLPRIGALKAQSDLTGVTDIGSIDDLVPLLFNAEAYKSYPLSLLEKGRFDLLTKWMGSLTTLDLSGIDCSDVRSIDEWLGRLEAEAPLAIVHTSGTSGKLSLIPRSTTETDAWVQSYLKTFAPFGDEPGEYLGRPGDATMPVVSPIVRNGRASGQRVAAYMERHVAPTPGELYTMPGTLSADVLSLAGRIRVAQAKGELNKLVLTPELRAAMRQHLAEAETRQADMLAFFDGITGQLAGQRILLFGFSFLYYQASQKGLAEGRRHIFRSDSVMNSSGGNSKGHDMADNWQDILKEYIGVRYIKQNYGMTEMGVMPYCSHDHFHIPPYYIPFLLDPVDGRVLPRRGTVTGRFAFFNLIEQTIWGGGISGDKVTIEWDRPCGCGRKGAHLRNDVTRYPANVSGDDKIVCAATVDNTDTALQQLLAI